MTSLPSRLTLAPLLTPVNPSYDPDVVNEHTLTSHLALDFYIVHYYDHLEDGQVDALHALVDQLCQEYNARLIEAGSTKLYGGVGHKYSIGKYDHLKATPVLKGHAVHMSPETLDAVRALDGIKFIEQDVVVEEHLTQNCVSWGLGRISHTVPSQDITTPYLYDAVGGAGVDVYVLDTGINIGHRDFQGVPGRVTFGYNAVPSDPTVNPPYVANPEDVKGHGTHVAGTIGSNTYGVAKSANLISVKVLCGLKAGSAGTPVNKGQYTIDGIQWVMNRAAAKIGQVGFNGSIMNMSLGSATCVSIDTVVRSAIAAGIHVVASAGNKTQSASGYTPAGTAGVITVGAVDRRDMQSGFSNYGNKLALSAPGQDILSTWIQGTSSTNTVTNLSTGTSMAAPHVTGVVAYMLSREGAPMPPNDLEYLLCQMADDNAAMLPGVTPGPNPVPVAIQPGTPSFLLFNTHIL